MTFGSDDAPGYNGFKYLVEQTVTISNPKSGKEESFTVFVPNGERVYLYGSNADGEAMGVRFHLNLEPEFSYNPEIFTLEENLRKNFVESWLDSAANNMEDGKVYAGEVKLAGDAHRWRGRKKRNRGPVWQS